MPAAPLLSVLAALQGCAPVIMNYGHFCNDGIDNVTQVQCEAALRSSTNDASKLVITNDAGTIPTSRWPSGCVYKTEDGSMWWNTDETNDATNEMRAVCCLPQDVTRGMAQLAANTSCNTPSNYIMISDKSDCETFADGATVTGITAPPGTGTGGCYKDISTDPPEFYYNSNGLVANHLNVDHAPICYAHAAAAPRATEIWLTGGVDLIPASTNNPDGSVSVVKIDQGGHTDDTCPTQGVVCASCVVNAPPHWHIDPASSSPIDGRQGHSAIAQPYADGDIALCYIGGADAPFTDDATAAAHGIQSYVCDQVSDRKNIHGTAVPMVSANSDQPWSSFLSASAKVPGSDTFIFGGYQTENDLVLWRGQLLGTELLDNLVLTSRFPGTYFADHALVAMSDAATDRPTLYIVGGYNPKTSGNQPIHQNIIAIEPPLEEIEVAGFAIINTPLSGLKLPYGVDQGVHGAAAVLVNDRYIWIIGGCLGAFVSTCKCTDKVVQFDTETSIISALPDLARPRCDARAIIDVVDNKPGVYVVGGWQQVDGGPVTVHTVEYVNTDSLHPGWTWQQTSNCTQACEGGGVACNSLQRVRFALAATPRLEVMPTTATSSGTSSQTTTAQTSTSGTSTATVTGTSTGSTTATPTLTSTLTTTPTTTATPTKPPAQSRSNRVEKWMAKDNGKHTALICGGVVVLVFSCVLVTRFISRKQNGYSGVSNGNGEVEMSDSKKDNVAAHFL